MAVTLIDTPAAANANSYPSVAEADIYMEARPRGEAWALLTADAKAAMLISATRLIDTLCFLGTATTSTQALSWPRTGMLNRNGYEIDAMGIPNDLKAATIELANLLRTSERLGINEASELGLTRLKAGPVELGFSSGGAVFAAVPASISSLLPASWLCEVLPEGTTRAFFEVL